MDLKKLDIGPVLESIRHEKGIKDRRVFAKSCGVELSDYLKLITDKASPTIEALEKICHKIGIPVEVFIFRAINEDLIEDTQRKKLISEIKPLIQKISDQLYPIKKEEAQ